MYYELFILINMKFENSYAVQYSFVKSIIHFLVYILFNYILSGLLDKKAFI